MFQIANTILAASHHNLLKIMMSPFDILFLHTHNLQTTGNINLLVPYNRYLTIYMYIKKTS